MSLANDGQTPSTLTRVRNVFGEFGEFAIFYVKIQF